jgi:hypothetical protein
VSSLAMALTSPMFGPFVLVPSLVLVNAIMFVLAPDRSRRAAVVVVSCLAVVAPALLDWAGVIPPFYRFDDESITMLPNMVHFPPLATKTTLLAFNIAMVVTACLLIGRFRDTLTRAEHRLHMQAWQLRQLVPAEAHAAANTAPPPFADICAIDARLGSRS